LRGCPASEWAMDNGRWKEFLRCARHPTLPIFPRFQSFGGCVKSWVVGGAGYIGSHVCKALLAAGHGPVVFDDLSTGRRENLPANVKLRVGSILDPEALKSAAAEHRFDGVVHLAALKA